MIEEVSPNSQVKEDSSWDELRIKGIVNKDLAKSQMNYRDRSHGISYGLSHGLSLKKQQSDKMYTILSKDMADMENQPNTIILYVNGFSE